MKTPHQKSERLILCGFFTVGSICGLVAASFLGDVLQILAGSLFVIPLTIAAFCLAFPAIDEK
jgi:hypothetical protein